MSAQSPDNIISHGRLTRALIYAALILFAVFYLLPLYVMLVNSLARLADQGIARPPVLSARWRLSEAVARAGHSLPSLLRALATLQPMELAFASLCAEHDLREARSHA